jgi:flagellar motor switch protein FliG
MNAIDLITSLSDADIQELLKHIPRELLVRCLAHGNDDFSNLIFRNVSARARQILEEDIEEIGTLDEESLSEADTAIIRIARKAAAEGKITCKLEG